MPIYSKSLFQQLVENTKLGKLLYGDNTYTDGYGTTRKDASLSESAQGQELKRAADTAKTAGKIVLTGAALTNPLTATSTLGSVLSTGGQAYFLTEGLNDAVDRVKNGNTVEDGVMLGLDVLPAASVTKTVTNGIKRIVPTVKQELKSVQGSITDAIQNINLKLGPQTWKQGDDAVKMFKRYGIEIPKIETSPLMERIKKYVPEARERYGLVNNTNITDDEIAGSLYKKAMSLSKKGNAAVNEFGEPLLLFRGDTQRYNRLKMRPKPDEMVSGTMDNSLGNLFLGEYPYIFQGADRYLGTITDLGIPQLSESGTGSDIIKTFKESFQGTIPEGSRLLYSHTVAGLPLQVYKLPAKYMNSGVNDLNAFVVNTKAVRNATPEISVLNDDFLLMGGKRSTLHTKPLSHDVTSDVGRISRDSEARKAINEHYNFVLNDAQQKGEGLLKSEKNSILREEHPFYDYYALPNFNINGAKSILQYDLNRKSLPFIDRGFVYRKRGGTIEK